MVHHFINFLYTYFLRVETLLFGICNEYHSSLLGVDLRMHLHMQNIKLQLHSYYLRKKIVSVGSR